MIYSAAISFTVKAQNGGENYTYVFRLCEDAGGVSEAGVIQVDNKKNTTIIGKYTDVQLIGSSK